MPKLLKFWGGVGAALILAVTSGSVANATESGSPETVYAYVRTADGSLVPLDKNVTALTIEEPSTRDPEMVTPYLIDWNQWFSCFSLNNESDVISQYGYMHTDGTYQDVNLYCGTHNSSTGSGYGYKHIRAGHESDWSIVWGEATSLGWNSKSQGIESWDDLMNAAVVQATAWGLGGNVRANNTRCIVADLIFVRTGTGEIAYETRTETVFATDSAKLITAFPFSTKTSC